MLLNFTPYSDRTIACFFYSNEDTFVKRIPFLKHEAQIIILTLNKGKLDAWVIFEARFTGLREICEIWRNVNLVSNLTEKWCEPGLHKLGSHKLGLLTLFIK